MNQSRKEPHRNPAASSRFLPVLVGILLLASLLHFHGIVQTLPYRFANDEPTIWARVDYLLKTGHLNSSYPPLRLFSLMIEFKILNSLSPNGASVTIQYLAARVTTALYTLLMFAAAYQAGKQIHSPAAGIVAVLYLVAHPTVAAYAKIFKTDSFAWFWGMMTVAAAFRALRTQHRGWVLVAYGCGVAALFSKYSMLPVLALPAAVSIIVLPQTEGQRKAILGVLAVIILIGLAVLLDPSQVLLRLLPDHAYILGGIYELEDALSLAASLRLWAALSDNLGQVHLGVATGVALMIVMWKRKHVSRSEINRLALLAMPILITYLMLVPLTFHRPQDWMLIVLCAALIWGMLLAMAAGSGVVVTTAVGLVLALGGMVNIWQTSEQLIAEDTRELTAEWAAETVPSGTHIATEQNHGEFVTLAELHPDKRFFLHEIDSVYEQSLEEFAAQGIEYLIADSWQLERSTGFFFRSPAQNADFVQATETVLNLSDPNRSGRQGPSRRVFKVPSRQQYPMHVFLGDEVIFKGFDLPSPTYSAGDVADFVFYWSMLAETDQDYRIFVHVISDDGELAAQQDGPPLGLANPTYDWLAGSFSWGKWSILLPDALSAGTYTLKIGMYDRHTQMRLPAVNADGEPLGDSIVMTEIRVTESP